MAIVVKCTACGRRFRGKNSDDGKTTHCPQCRASVVVNGQRVKDYDVFISYAPEQADVARTTCEALEAKGMRCWLVSRDVAAGVDVFAATQEAMDDSRVVVKIAIAGAATPRAVAKEVERALAAGTPVVPLQIKPAAAGGAGESLLVAAEHRAGRGSALEQSLKDLVREVKALLRMREESVHVRKEPISGKAGDGAKSQKPGSAGLRRTATIMAVMIVVAGVLVSINALSESPKVAPGPLAEAVPSTTSQPAEIEQPVMTQTAADAKIQADAAYERIASIDRGQGVGELIDQAKKQRDEAAALLARGQSDAAVDLFETVIQAADVIDSTDAQRKLAVTARLQAEEARATLLSKSEVQRRAELSSYRDAEATQGKAFAHFEAGNFGDARTAWAAAATGFATALAESSATPGSDASKRLAEATERIQPTEPTPPTTPQPVETSSVRITSRKEWHPIIRVKRGQTMKIEVTGSWEFSRLDFVERLSGKIFPSGASFVIGKGGEFEAKADGLLFIGIGSRRRLYPNIPGSVTARVLLYPAAKTEDPPVPQAAQGTVDLLALIDPAQDAFNGIWGGGKSKPLAADGYARLRIPYEPPAEYDFSVIFSKKPNEGRRRVQVWFSQGGRQWTCGLEITNAAKAASFFFPVAGKLLRGPDLPFEYGTMHSMIVKVRQGSVAVLLDDRPLNDWRFEASEPIVAPYDAIGAGVLGIGARGEVIFHRVELVAVSPGGGTVQSAAMHHGKVLDQLIFDNNDAAKVPNGTKVTRPGPVVSLVSFAGLEDVVLLHPSRPDSPVTLMFNALTNNIDGTLRLQLHGPGKAGGRADLSHKGKINPIRIEGNNWIPAEVKFSRGDALTLNYYPDPGNERHLYVSCELTLEGRRAAGAATTQPE